jgi:hypothetical protein
MLLHDHRTELYRPSGSVAWLIPDSFVLWVDLIEPRTLLKSGAGREFDQVERRGYNPVSIIYRQPHQDNKGMPSPWLSLYAQSTVYDPISGIYMSSSCCIC